MPESFPIQNAFNGGQFGPRTQGRSDLARYSTACNRLRNFHVTMQGPVVKRSGTRFVIPAKYPDRKARLIEFEFSREQAYMLELGDQYMRVFRENGVILEAANNIGLAPNPGNPVSIFISAHGYATGDTVRVEGSGMSEINNRFFDITVLDVNQFSLDGEDGTGRSSVGSAGTVSKVFEIATPYTQDQLFDIQTAQSQDVLYLAHPDVPPTKIARTSDIEWTVDEVVFETIPFQVENVTDVTIGADVPGTGVALTLTASEAMFTTDMIGSDIQLSELPPVSLPQWRSNSNPSTWIDGILLPGSGQGRRCYQENNVYEYTAVDIGPPIVGFSGFDPPVHEEGAERDSRLEWTFINRGNGYGRITSITGPSPSTQCEVDVDTAGVEYPRSVQPAATLDGGGSATKKWAFGAWNPRNGYPRAVAFFEDRLWFGGTNRDPQALWGSRTGLYEDFEVVGDEDDSGLLFVLASDKINAIEWLSGDDTLLIGTRGSEYTADSGSADASITPSNIRVRRRSNYGSASNIQPITVDSALLFVHRSGRRLHELVYDFDSDRYIAPDLTELSYNILDAGVVELAYQASPFRQVWASLADGTLASLTYVKDQDVIGWAPHLIGGADARVESIGAIPHPDDDEDQLWMLVNRTVDGQTVRYIEYLEKPFEIGDSLSDSFFVDSGLTYANPSQIQANGFGTIFGNSVVLLDSDPTGILSIGDVVVISGIMVESENDAVAASILEGIELTITSISTDAIGVVDDQGGFINLEALENGTPAGNGSFNGVFQVVERTNSVTGLHHLEGETVRVLGDGVVLTDAVVTDGEISLGGSGAGIVHIGLAQPSAQLETMRLEAGLDGIGSAQGKIKRIHQFVVRVDQTGDGLLYGAELTGTLDPWDRSDEALPSGAIPLYTGDSPDFEVPGGYSRKGRLAISHDTPLPCTVVAIMPHVTAETR